jgi:1-deoxy-D-xylulose-5-phosphate reductoisomerase
MKRLAILGSTGSIGQSALSLVDMFPDRFQVVALAANARADLLREQADKYRPRIVALYEAEAASRLQESLPGMHVVSGREGVIAAAVAPEVEMVVAGISGAAGLEPTYHAIQAGKDVALANKETLVIAGHLIMQAAKSRGVQLLPVDSEHSALHQCLRGSPPADIGRLVLTASGGPFFGYSRKQLEQVSVEQALNHPTWRMGKKITVDSATLMNKGLEVIEAHHLFKVDSSQITVVIHPQSTVHSMVEFVDGTVLAQLSITDMRAAILYALSYPERWHSELPRLDLTRVGPLEFHPPDADLFPCLGMAYAALREGPSYPAALNAANEIAVDAFLRRRISFTAIPAVIDYVLQNHRSCTADTLEGVLEIDRMARKTARDFIKLLAA